MSWQALAARRQERLDDDESWRAVVDAWTAVYAAARDIIWSRVEARLAVVAAAGASDQWITADEWSDALEQAGVHDVVSDLVNDGIVAVAQDVGLPINDAMLSDQVEDFVLSFSDALDFIRDALDTFFDDSMAARRAAPDKWPPRRFRQALDEAPNSPVTPVRAERFGTSVANGALNAGYRAALSACSIESAGQFADASLASCDRVAAIRWVTQRDERVRPAHVAADKDTILVDQEFDIDGHPASYPGDPRLPIGLRINCRCVLAWVDGTEVRRIAGALKSDLYAKAQELDIRGRSTMTKAELQSAILEALCQNGLAGGPDCPDLFEQMNRTALMVYAKQENIVGRWRMTKPELIQRLRATLRGDDRLRVRQGYAPQAEFDASQRLASRKRRNVARFGPGEPPPTFPNSRTRRSAREAVFEEFGGPDRGYVPCAFCGLKVHPDPTAGLAVLVPTPIRPFAAGGTASVVNMLPADAACFQAHRTVGSIGAIAASGPKPDSEEEWGGTEIELDPEIFARHRARVDAMPEADGGAEFHLQGQHDQQTHGNRGKRTMPTDAVEQVVAVENIYSTTFKNRDGDQFWIAGYEGDAPDIYSSNWGDGSQTVEAEGTIIDADGEIVGEFSRRYNFSERSVRNLSLKVSPTGRGIGSAFLDATEEAAADAGFETVTLSAVATGRYAWAARGYRLADYRAETIGNEVQISVRDTWIKSAESVARVGLSDAERADTRKVLTHWQNNPDDVYPADLLAVSPEFRMVFQNGPNWPAARSLVPDKEPALAASAPTPLLDHKVRSWKDLFHLQGQHDQSTHGNRGGTGDVPDGARAMDDDEWAEREGNERLDGDGDCYPTANSIVTAHLGQPDEDEYRLVHGVVSGQGELDGVRFDHAWVERTETPDLSGATPEIQEQFDGVAFTWVIDRSNGNDLTLPKELYYRVGQIDDDTVRRYTPVETARNMVKYRHHGPWEDDQ